MYVGGNGQVGLHQLLYILWNLVDSGQHMYGGGNGQVGLHQPLYILWNLVDSGQHMYGGGSGCKKWVNVIVA